MAIMIPKKKEEKCPTPSPAIHPRKLLLPPIHDRDNRYYATINWSGKNGGQIKGIENGWIRDIFQQWNETVFHFTTYRNCSNCISNFGITYDKTAMNQDYLPTIKKAIQEELLEPIASPGALNQYMTTMTNVKQHLLIAAFARGERPTNFLEEEKWQDEYAIKALEDYVPSVKVRDNKEKLQDIIRTTELELVKFMIQFEQDMLNYENYDTISKYTRDQAKVYMLLCNGEEFKTNLRRYETYCRVIAICEARYEELVKYRFSKELEKMKNTVKYKDLTTDKDFIDAMMLRYEKALADKQKTLPYNPKYYIELLNGHQLSIPRTFKYVKSVFDIDRIKKYIQLWDADNVQYLSYVWNSDADTWKIINGLDRVLNEDNVHYVNGELALYTSKHKSPYNFKMIQELDLNKKPDRKSRKSNVKNTNVIDLTVARYKFLNK